MNARARFWGGEARERGERRRAREHPAAPGLRRLSRAVRFSSPRAFVPPRSVPTPARPDVEAPRWVSPRRSGSHSPLSSRACDDRTQLQSRCSWTTARGRCGPGDAGFVVDATWRDWGRESWRRCWRASPPRRRGAAVDGARRRRCGRGVTVWESPSRSRREAARPCAHRSARSRDVWTPLICCMIGSNRSGCPCELQHCSCAGTSSWSRVQQSDSGRAGRSGVGCHRTATVNPRRRGGTRTSTPPTPRSSLIGEPEPRSASASPSRHDSTPKGAHRAPTPPAHRLTRDRRLPHPSHTQAPARRGSVRLGRDVVRRARRRPRERRRRPLGIGCGPLRGRDGRSGAIPRGGAQGFAAGARRHEAKGSVARTRGRGRRWGARG